jgi:hypothetical protein
MDFDSERCRSSTKLLENHGFTVEKIKPLPHASPRRSNYHTFHRLVRDAAGAQGWTYFFEDDLSVPGSRLPLSALLAHEEHERCAVQYFGVRSTSSRPEGNGGVLAHAWGVRADTAARLAAYADGPKYNDRSDHAWDMALADFCKDEHCCLFEGQRECIPGDRKLHRGYMCQDRKRFPSQIPKE